MIMKYINDIWVLGKDNNILFIYKNESKYCEDCENGGEAQDNARMKLMLNLSLFMMIIMYLGYDFSHMIPVLMAMVPQTLAGEAAPFIPGAP